MVYTQLIRQLEALFRLVEMVTDTQFTRPVRHLAQASIGGHTRHILEILQCTVLGHALGFIDYHNRERDLQLENSRSKVMAAIVQLIATLQQPDKPIRILTETDQESEQPFVESSYLREILFNAEHATHHMALIRVALIDMDLAIVPDDFGVAASTLKFKAMQACAQ